MINKPKPVLRLYVKADCSPCEKMKRELFDIKQEYGFEFEIHDINTQKGGKERYGDLVPVLLWGQDVICYHSLDKKLLARALGIEVPPKSS